MADPIAEVTHTDAPSNLPMNLAKSWADGYNAAIKKMKKAEANFLTEEGLVRFLTERLRIRLEGSFISTTLTIKTKLVLLREDGHSSEWDGDDKDAVISTQTHWIDIDNH